MRSYLDLGQSFTQQAKDLLGQDPVPILGVFDAEKFVGAVLADERPGLWAMVVALE